MKLSFCQIFKMIESENRDNFTTNLREIKPLVQIQPRSDKNTVTPLNLHNELHVVDLGVTEASMTKEDNIQNWIINQKLILRV